MRNSSTHDITEAAQSVHAPNATPNLSPALAQLHANFPAPLRFNNRELSWLEFNERVLEEACDAAVPLLERIKFLAIFASNLDEFFMVRVATVQRQIEAGVTKPGPEGLTPSEVMALIKEKVQHAHESIGACFRGQLMPELEKAGIILIDERTATKQQVEFASKYFHKHVKPLLTPLALDPTHPFPQLENKALYFCVELGHRKKSKMKMKLRLALVPIPSQTLGRFVPLPAEGDKHFVIRLDDIIRLNLHEIFPNENTLGCYALKVVRDAELEIVADEAQDLLETIAESLEQRKRGPATRFLYDPEMPLRVLEMFVKRLKLDPSKIFPGARYHSFSDFMQFPGFEAPHLQNPPMPPLPVGVCERSANMFSVMRQQDVMVHHPYQKFDYVVRFLEEAADDPEVKAIKMTLYRVSSKSPVAKALGRAAKHGKKVFVLVELQARFDEETNINWARKLEKEGVHVMYGVPGLKTHAKLALVVRKEEEGVRRYCHLATGNYNDRTAQIYGDLGLFTTHERICAEVAQVFDLITGYAKPPGFEHLLVAPQHMREEFLKRIRREAENALHGKRAGIIAKMNSLVDPEMIDALYLASQAGVPIQLIVRGICCLRPGVAGLSENIKVLSIIDRFLEHARVYIFENDGRPEYLLASADWMPRNLNTRVEVGFPILAPEWQQYVREIITTQLADNVKARVLNADSTNVRHRTEGREMRAQVELYEMAKRWA
ncbi:polyphosphate kinase 1 [candidate division KSB1 bacterium]|nr:polyphosphate kinase 1 [candidate division KSB1 bacterium]